MISSAISRASALFLVVAGVALLFAADIVLPAVFPGFPPTAVWLGQLIAAGWLAVGALNWQSRALILGGIYGRPVVYANVMLYVVTATSMFKPLLAVGASPLLWLVGAPAMVFALVYGVLLFRGPFDALQTAKPKTV